MIPQTLTWRNFQLKLLHSSDRLAQYSYNDGMLHIQCQANYYLTPEPISYNSTIQFGKANSEVYGYLTAEEALNAARQVLLEAVYRLG